MNKNAYKNDILFVLISTFIVISIWVGTDIYNKSITSTLDKTLEFQLLPIQGKFDMKTIAGVRSRTRVDPLIQGVSKQASSPATPTPSVEISPVDQSASSGGAVGI